MRQRLEDVPEQMHCEVLRGRGRYRPCKDKFDLLRSSTSDGLCYAKKNDKHAGSIWHGNAETQDECMSKCTADSECKYFSFWHTGWCQLDRVCNHWGSDGSRMISTFGRDDGVNQNQCVEGLLVQCFVMTRLVRG